jgi:hypothetical protein
MYNQPRTVHRVIHTLQQATEADQYRHVRLFKSGDWIMIYQPHVAKKSGEEIKVRKLVKHWRGPYQIIYRINELTYMVRMGNRSVPINVNRLKPYISRGVADIEPY